MPEMERIIGGNDRDLGQQADDNHSRLEDAGVLGVNLMAAPGAGKTSLIQCTLDALSSTLRIGIVEAITGVNSLESEALYQREVPLVQVDTGGAAQLDAVMLSDALRRLPLAEIDLLLVENVGNLVYSGPCRLGLQANVIIASVPEGHDKPYRYSEIYRGADAVVLNKMDLLPWVSFDLGIFRRGVELLSPGAPVLPLSCYTGADLHRWIDWLALASKRSKGVTAAGCAQ